jgi:hypothetical protein
MRSNDVDEIVGSPDTLNVSVCSPELPLIANPPERRNAVRCNRGRVRDGTGAVPQSS